MREFSVELVESLRAVLIADADAGDDFGPAPERRGESQSPGSVGDVRPVLLAAPYLIEIDRRARTALAARRDEGSRSGRSTATDMTGRASELP
ncbi:hypothetical protein [Streptomyces sp. NPDC055709]